MTKEKKINCIFLILVQFEQLQENEDGVTEDSYKNYLDKLNVWYLGQGNEEIGYIIEGLKKLGKQATHDTVKRSVFHIISILDKEVQ